MYGDTMVVKSIVLYSYSVDFQPSPSTWKCVCVCLILFLPSFFEMWLLVRGNICAFLLLCFVHHRNYYVFIAFFHFMCGTFTSTSTHTSSGHKSLMNCDSKTIRVLSQINQSSIPIWSITLQHTVYNTTKS